MKLAIGSDHAGFPLKERVKNLLRQFPCDVIDVGTHSDDSVDYPDFAERVARLVAEGKAERGIVVCGTGIGVSIAANKIPGIRAALCLNPFMVEMARRHNNANVLTLGARIEPQPGDEELLEMLRRWIETPFEGGRHARRVEKIHLLERSLSSV